LAFMPVTKIAPAIMEELITIMAETEANLKMLFQLMA